jgi:hypothetical protein
MHQNPIEIQRFTAPFQTESISSLNHTEPEVFDSKFEEHQWPVNCDKDGEESSTHIPGINVYLANAAYEVLIENGVFPAVRNY